MGLVYNYIAGYGHQSSTLLLTAISRPVSYRKSSMMIEKLESNNGQGAQVFELNRFFGGADKPTLMTREFWFQCGTGIEPLRDGFVEYASEGAQNVDGRIPLKVWPDPSLSGHGWSLDGYQKVQDQVIS